VRNLEEFLALLSAWTDENLFDTNEGVKIDRENRFTKYFYAYASSITGSESIALIVGASRYKRYGKARKTRRRRTLPQCNKRETVQAK